MRSLVDQRCFVADDPLDGVIAPIGLAAEPARSGLDERATLVSFLDYFRSVLIRKATGLTRAQLARSLAPSSLTIGGLVKHMVGVEEHWFQTAWAGRPEMDLFDGVDWDADRDWEFHSAADDHPLDLLGWYETACARSRAVIDGADDLDALAVGTGDTATSLRWILVHMVEEYARHCGHADLIRESIDGTTDD